MGELHIGRTIVEGFTKSELDGFMQEVGPRLARGDCYWQAITPRSSGPVVVWLHPGVDLALLYDQGEEPSD